MKAISFDCDNDPFVSKLNTQLPAYVSFLPDPGALAVATYALTWRHLHFYAFPPFSIILNALQKVKLDEANRAIMVPIGFSQFFISVLLHMLISDPVWIQRHQRLLQIATKQAILHALHKKLNFLCGLISKIAHNIEPVINS